MALFFFLGITGHDPWLKRDETYSFGIIYHFFVTHSWLVPTDAGMPFMEKPPLYYWTAVKMCQWFGDALPLHDAARLASIVYLAIATAFMWKTSLLFFRKEEDCRAHSSIALALLLGTYGLVRYGHAMSTDVALLAGTCVALYGMVMLCADTTRWKIAGAWLGLGLGIAFMSKGVVMPGILGLSGIILCAALPELRTRKTLWALIAAFIVASPFLLIWPALLYRQSPELFTQWLWDNNFGRFFGFATAYLDAKNNRPSSVLNTFDFAFPVFPLACVQLFRARKEWREPRYLLPATISAVGIATFLLAASGRTVYLLPLLPLFALLAAQTLVRIPTRLLAGWNVLARIGFSLSAIVTWLIWWILRHPADTKSLAWLPAIFSKWLPPAFVPPADQTTACILALIATAFWIASLRLEKRSAAHTAYIWFAGVVVTWGTIYTLLLPWLNETRSYRTVMTQLSDFVRESPYAGDCIGYYQWEENGAPMFQYFTHQETPLTIQTLDGKQCPLLLAYVDINIPSDIDPHWHLIWSGKRIRDINFREFRLYLRQK